jgi:hypothetical protein
MVEAPIESALKETEFCRDWRNRYITHRDLNLTLDQPKVSLADGSRKQVDAALKAVAETMKAMQAHYLNAETCFDPAARHHGANTLLHILDGGLKAKRHTKKDF